MADAPPGRTRANIEIIIFGYLVSLTLKGALDTAFGKTIPAHVTSTSQLTHEILVFPTIQLAVFMVTLLRFVYGTFRLQEESPKEPGNVVLVWNVVGILVLFVLFYLCSLTILHAAPFYFAMATVHVWDIVWFLPTVLFSKDMTAMMKKLIWIFIAIDSLTVLSLTAAHYCFRDHFMGAAVFIMLLFAMLDFGINFKFFFKPDEWRHPISNSISEG